MPLVSVLMPAYNAESTVRRAMESLLRQTFDDFEVVAVNDGSEDATARILDEIAEKDRRVRAVHRPHSGLIESLNVGLVECRGELIARMDADDYSHPERLRLQVEHMTANPEVSVCGCLVRSFPRAHVKAGFLKYENWLNSLTSHEEIARDMFVESPLAHPSVIMRAAELSDFGGYRDMGWPEDYDLWLRYSAAGKQFGKVSRVLLFWREHADRLTFTDGRYSLENFIRLKAHFLSQLISKRGRPLVVWGAGMTGRRLIKHMLREGAKPEVVLDVDQRKIGMTLRGIPIVSAEALFELGNAFVVAAVGSAHARRLIRDYLRERGLNEGCDFVCAA